MQGTRLGLNPQASDFYVQSMAPPGNTGMPRAAIESILRKKNIQSFKTSSGLYWLETCFCHSATNGLVATGHNVGVATPAGAQIRPPDAITCWLNDPGNYEALKAVRDINPDVYMGNEIPQWGAYAIERMFGAKAEFSWIHDFKKVAQLVSAGNAVEFAIKKPEHFECFIAYDESTDELIYVDPAPYRSPSDWWHRRMSQQEYENTTQPFSILIPAA